MKEEISTIISSQILGILAYLSSHSLLVGAILFSIIYLHFTQEETEAQGERGEVEEQYRKTQTENRLRVGEIGQQLE